MAVSCHDGLPAELESLPQGWDYLPLSRLIDADRGICYGVVQPGADTEMGVPIVRVNNIKQGRIDTRDVLRIAEAIESKYRRSRLRGDEVLLTLVGSLGETAIVPSELAGWNVARAVGVIPVNNEVGPRWIELCLRSAISQRFIHMWATTTVQATLNLRDVANLPIPLPPAQERDVIAHVLGTLDDKIELNRRINETLEGIARAIFKSWFVDFDPVRAKAEGRDLGLPKHIADLFPDNFEDTSLGPIPAGWTTGTLGNIAEHPRRRVQPDEIDALTPYIGLEHMPRRAIALNDWEHAESLESNKFAFHRGEILFGKLRPYFHKVGIAPLNGVCSTDIVVITPKAPAWFGFVLCHASSIDFVEHTNAGSTGTKMPRTSWKDMAAYRLSLPPEQVSQAFTDMVTPMTDRIIANIHESRTLAAIRDSLLPKLLSGEIRIGDVRQLREARA